MPTRDELRALLFLRAALPLTKIVREENALARRLTKTLRAVIQFQVAGSDVGSHLVFADDTLEVLPGIHENPTVRLIFKDLRAMNTLFAGGLALPRIKGKRHLHAVVRMLPLLLGLKMLMPNADPKEPKQRALKVKMLLYMVTTALSQLNKAGDPLMLKLTEKSPDRIYQWVVEGTELAAFLRMKAGKTKAGRSVYTRRRPFVLMRFPNIEGAYQVLTSKVALVEAVKAGYVVTEGAMEYSKEIGFRMQYIEELLTKG